MAGSYRKINYSLRPAKQIERKMMCEAFRRLTEFGALESYRYIGFGSPYFTDFQLVHKLLNVQSMVSIEKKVNDRPRFEFNRPFGCISLEWGESNAVLPRIRWDARSLVWLDYDGGLDLSVLTDIGFVCGKAPPGSAVVFSVSVESSVEEEKPLEILEKAVEKKRVPQQVGEMSPEGRMVQRPITNADLAGWNRASVYWTIIRNEIEDVLRRRNGGSAEWHWMQFRQIFHFRYQDNAKMLTVGGVLYDRGQEAIAARCAFPTLPFVREGAEPYKIEVPLLTYRELRHLDTQLPVADIAQLNAPGVPRQELERYAATYRWFPMFAESEM